MVYRVVKRANGQYQCQHRVLFFFWFNSIHDPSDDLSEQRAFIAAVHQCLRDDKLRRQARRIICVLPPKAPAHD